MKPVRPYRRYTAEQIQAVKAWKPFRALCRELGIPVYSAQHIRGYYYKRPIRQ